MSAAALADLLRERQPCVVLTGAGISTESGIPDFRSPTGIWAEVDPLEVASIQAFRRDPERVWSFYRTRIHSLLAAEPNAGHVALAELERRGLVHAVVTQNIDTLHRRAGSREVVEMHGSIRSATCPNCLWTEGIEGVLAQLEEHAAPLCIHCGEILKPGVTLFGELLPRRARSSVRPSSPAPLRSCWSSAPPSRCGRWPGFLSRHAPSQSSIGARRRSTTRRS